MDSPRRRVIPTAIGVAVFATAVCYIVLTFQWSELAGILTQADPIRFVGIGTATIIAYWMLRSLRWALLLRADRKQTSFIQLYLVTAFSLGLSIVTPLQSGEIAKIEWLKKHSEVARKSAYSAFALERLLDLFVVCAMGLPGLLMRTTPITTRVTTLPWLLGGLLVGIGGFVAALRILRFGGRVGELLQNFRSLLGDTKLLIGVFLVTVTSWSVVGLGWQASLGSVSVTLGFLDSLTLVSVVTIVNVISIVPGAIGVSEVGVTEFLRAFGHDQVFAQAGAVIVRAYGLLILALALIHLAAFRTVRSISGMLTKRRAAKARSGLERTHYESP